MATSIAKGGPTVAGSSGRSIVRADVPPATSAGRLLLTEKQAAEQLQVSRTVLWGLRKSGKIGYVRIGETGVRYLPEQLADFVTRMRKEAQ